MIDVIPRSSCSTFSIAWWETDREVVAREAGGDHFVGLPTTEPRVLAFHQDALGGHETHAPPPCSEPLATRPACQSAEMSSHGLFHSFSTWGRMKDSSRASPNCARQRSA